MRSIFVAAAALLTFLMMLTFPTTDANAVVCARGVVRAGCVSAGGAAVVPRHPFAAMSSSTAYAFAAASSLA
jgi:hypothetical protein